MLKRDVLSNLIYILDILVSKYPKDFNRKSQSIKIRIKKTIFTNTPNNETIKDVK